MTLGILASGRLGHAVLKQLASYYTLNFVMTDAGSLEIQSFCHEEGIGCFVGNPRQGKCAHFIEGKIIDVLVSVNYLFVIEQDLIELPKKIAFNIHGSLLPKYRGRTPHIWAIINNEKTTGITAHIIDAGCDTGAIIEQIQVPIESKDTGATMLDKFEALYPTLVNQVLSKIKHDQISLTPQKEHLATYFGKRTPEDGQIDWNWQRERIGNWVRAQAPPYPGAFSWHDGEKFIIAEVELDDFGFNWKMPNGLILTTNPLRIKTSNGVLRLTKTKLLNLDALSEGIILK